MKRRNKQLLLKLSLLTLLLIGMSLSDAQAQPATISECIEKCDNAIAAKDTEIAYLEKVVLATEELALEEAKEVDRLSAPIRHPSVLILGGGVLALAAGPLAILGGAALGLLL